MQTLTNDLQVTLEVELSLAIEGSGSLMVYAGTSTISDEDDVSTSGIIQTIGVSLNCSMYIIMYKDS